MNLLLIFLKIVKPTSLSCWELSTEVGLNAEPKCFGLGYWSWLAIHGPST
jgi:hypothetical protein